MEEPEAFGDGGALEVRRKKHGGTALRGNYLSKHMTSSKVVNDVANYDGPRHDEKQQTNEAVLDK